MLFLLYMFMTLILYFYHFHHYHLVVFLSFTFSSITSSSLLLSLSPSSSFCYSRSSPSCPSLPFLPCFPFLLITLTDEIDVSSSRLRNNVIGGAASGCLRGLSHTYVSQPEQGGNGAKRCGPEPGPEKRIYR